MWIYEFLKNYPQRGNFSNVNFEKIFEKISKNKQGWGLHFKGSGGKDFENLLSTNQPWWCLCWLNVWMCVQCICWSSQNTSGYVNMCICMYMYVCIYIYIYLYFSRLEHLNGIQWSWVQIPLGPTFYSYFWKSFSGEYHMYQFTPLQRDYQCETSLKSNVATMCPS